MTKKLIFLNVLIVSFFMLSACGAAISVELPVSDGTDPSISITDPALAPAAPAESGISNNVWIYIVIGLVVVIALIALIAVAGAGARNRSQ